MTTNTLERSPELAGDRSATAGAGAHREAARSGASQSADPEVASVAKRRSHSAEYKLRILAEIEANPGRTGIILRREGLYSSYLRKWRQWREGMSTTKKPTSANKQMHNEMAKLKRENARLKLKLQKAEGIIDLQKKASELLRLMSQSEKGDD